MGAYVAWYDKRNVFRVLQFDVVESETMTSTLTVTTHPIERGADIADHVKLETRRCSLTCFVSNMGMTPASLTKDGLPEGIYGPVLIRYPSYTPPILADVSGAVGRAFSPPVPLVTSVTGLYNPSPINRFEEVLKVLDQLQATAQLVECVTAAWSVQDAVLSVYSPERGAGDGKGSGRVQVDFEQVRIVSAKRVAVPLPAKPKMKPKARIGNQNPAPIDLDALPKSQKSIIVGLLQKSGVIQ